jgi:hypothetical protein
MYDNLIRETENNKKGNPANWDAFTAIRDEKS